ncbi:DUF2500 domain-containing protein [Caproiciproducens sp. MSJ-32]|uniref:DUF2500 domain-containing protein n=1 Tax=Caproiciproducens sp. MSJ-32 TaxID=2841527 RepID=UPI001C10869E|nr:DUF2500 domain-containing protein [Caproiciproducens sp. MSJ-32]MBU5455883.1 DUF2500 domain-containing protein [Caproiciproducens sp. MSJ-32]
MFDIVFSFMFPLFFILFFGIFIFTIVRNIKEWRFNNKQPIIPVETLVVSKRSSSHYHHHEHNTTSSTDYYVTFEFSNGERLELALPAREYGLIAEGDRGILSFQGTRFISFERK